LAGFQNTASREIFGSISLINCRRFPSRSGASEVSPVALPPGRARLAASPVPIGSPTATITRGMDGALLPTASAAGVPAVTITSTFDAANSAIRDGRRSY
jgi:hypothetical protein